MKVVDRVSCSHAIASGLLVFPTNETPQRTLGGEPLDVNTIGDKTSHSLVLLVLVLGELGETPILGDVHLLAAGELELGSAQGIDGNIRVLLQRTDGDEDAADVHTGDGAVRLSVGATHTGLQTICTGARKHLVHTQHVEGPC